MPEKPAYEELEKRIQELEREVLGRRKSEEALRESEEKYRLLAENATDALWVLDLASMRLSYRNAGVGTTLGYSTKEIMQLTLDDLLSPDSLNQVKKTLSEELARDDSHPDPNRVIVMDLNEVNKDGHNTWVEMSGRFLRDTAGRPVSVLGINRDITKRRQAEEALALERTQLLSIFDSIDEAIYVSDIATHEILYANRAMKKAFTENIIGKICYKAIQGLDSPCNFCTNGIIWKQKPEPYRWECHNPVLDKDFAIVDRIIKWPGGRDVRFELAIDITEQNRVRAALRHRIEMEKLIASVSSGFVGIPSDRIDGEINRTLQTIGQFTHVDRSYLFMVSDDGATFSNTHEWCAPGIDPQTERLQGIPAAGFQWWMEKLNSNEVIHVPQVDALPAAASAEKEIVRSQGIRSLLAVPLISGSRILGFFGFDAVRTEKFWTEEDQVLLRTIGEIISQRLESRRAEDALLESENKYRNIYENAQIGLFRTRLSDGLFLEANPRLVEMFGFDSREEFIGRVRAADLYAGPETRARMIAVLEDKGEIRNYDTRFKGKDGSIRWLRFSGTLHEEGGYLEGVAADITENKQSEAENIRLEEQYRQAQKVEAIGRLAGGVAHDMNNLLTPILGYGEMLMADFGPDDRRRLSVKQIVQAGYRCRDLVRQLLAFGRKQNLDYAPLDINKAIEGFEKLLRRTIREDITLDIIPASGVRTINADIGQIEQVIMNLAVNAQDAMPDGGRLTLETAMVEIDEKHAAVRPGTGAGQYVMLAISDNGCGMDDEVREHIFEPFFSTKGVAGTGLGLATVYGIVKQHGGNIWVYSEPGTGTIFKIYLPVSEEASLGKKSSEEPPQDLRGCETLLLVEDNKQVRDLGNDLLKQKGYTVLVAENGAEALRVLSSHPGPVHLLLTDVIMPGMNGKELFARAAAQHPDLKVLYMSGYTDSVIAHHGILDEGIQLIQKPFTVHGLATRVREVLEKD